MNVLDRHGFSPAGKTWIFIGVQWVFLTIQQAISTVIPDETDITLLQVDRQEFIVSKVIDRIPDEDTEQKVDVDDDNDAEVSGYRYSDLIKPYPMLDPAPENVDNYSNFLSIEMKNLESYL